MYRLSSFCRSVGFFSCVFCFRLLVSPLLAGDGDLDPGFGVKGMLFIIGDRIAYDEFLDVFVQEDGKILGIGYTQASEDEPPLIRVPPHMVVARFNPDGSFDASFGSGGKAVYEFGAQERGRAGLVLKDGKYLVVGQMVGSPQGGIFITRIQPDGALDTSFGNGGLLVFPGLSADAVLQLPDERVIVGATFMVPGQDFGVICLRPDGSLDTSFGEGGSVTVDFEAQDNLRRLALTLDGRILAAGISDALSLLACVITPDGSLDPTFGSEGKVILQAGLVEAPVRAESSVGLAVQLDGRVVIGSGLHELVLVRLNTDGSPDSSFGTGGLSRWDLTASFDILADLELQADGKIIAVGSVVAEQEGWGLEDDFLVARLASDGSPDPSFGINGWVATDFANAGGYGEMDYDGARAVAIQPDGKILLAGHGPDGEVDTWDIAMARYISSIDPAAAFAGLIASLQTTSRSRRSCSGSRSPE